MPRAPLVFQRARLLVEIAPAEPHATQTVSREEGTPILRTITPPRLRALLADAANWYSAQPRSKKLVPDMPATWVMDDILSREQWPFPPLTGLVSTPTLRPDGTVLDHPGYDPATGLFLSLNGTSFPSVPDSPTTAQLAHALTTLAEPFVDFPFAELCHKSVALAALLTMVSRYALTNVPLFAIRATTRGSGKTLLTDVISLMITGRKIPKISESRNEEEEDKRLLGLALEGDTIVSIDNVHHPLGNSALDRALTSQNYKGRLLGSNSNPEAPLYTVFFATGNNLTFHGDLARRVLPIDLAPQVEHPEARQHFQLGNADELMGLVGSKRPTYVSAALTLLRGYLAADMPRQALDAYGGFDKWNHLVCGCLVWLDCPNPLLARAGLENNSDEAFEAHQELLTAWYACYASKAMTLATIIGDIQVKSSPPKTLLTLSTEEQLAYDRLREALGGIDEKYDGQRLNAKRLGWAMRRLEGRIIDGKRIKKSPAQQFGSFWAIQCV